MTATDQPEGPFLGLATTRELASRLEDETRHTSPGGIDHPGHPDAGVRLAATLTFDGLVDLLAVGTDDVLDYRTAGR